MQQLRQDLAALDRSDCTLISKVIFYPKGAAKWKKQPIDLMRDREVYFETGHTETAGGLIRFYFSAGHGSTDAASTGWDIAKVWLSRAAEFIPADFSPWLLNEIRDPVQRWILALHIATNRNLVTWSDWDEAEFAEWMNGGEVAEAKWSDDPFPIVPCYSIAKPLGALSAMTLDKLADNGGGSNPSIANKAEQRVISTNDPRDKWLYNQCNKGTPYKEIKSLLAKKVNWDQLTTTNGVKRAANDYAKRKGLDPIPKRQKGRKPNR